MKSSVAMLEKLLESNSEEPKGKWNLGLSKLRQLYQADVIIERI